MRFGLIMSEVGQGLRRNFSMVVSVILVTFISLTFVGTAILLQMQIGEMKGYWYDKAQVTVYLCTDLATVANCNATEATDAERDAIEAKLKSPELAPLIDHYEFEDHQAAYDNYIEFIDSAESEYLTPEMLPEAFWVNMVDPSQADVLFETLSGEPGVDEVKDQREYLDPIFNALNAASYTAIGIAALMLVAAALLIATTIRLSAFSRRREIGIMRLVGASNRFIQTPFILEGVFAAVIGALMAGGATIAIVHFFVQGYLAELMASTGFVGLTEALLVAPVLLIVGIVLAAVSAGVAIARYLKV